MRAAVLAFICVAVAGCGGEPPVEERVAGGAMSAGEPPVVRVCRAATSVFNPQEPLGARTVPTASVEKVRLAYEPGPTSAGLTAECAFQGETVTWRLLSLTPAAGGVETPVERAPETATYTVEGGTVRLVQTRPDGGRTEASWTSSESGDAVSSDPTTEAE